MDHTIVHFEIPADDLDRATKFYREVFGWEISKMPGPFEYYRGPDDRDRRDPACPRGQASTAGCTSG